MMVLMWTRPTTDATKAGEGPTQTGQVGMIKVLLVDDSKFLRLATERALSRAGYEVSTASDGEEALRVAQEKLPDVIVLDMLLPKMTGPDVLKALKENPATADIPIVVFTSLSQVNAARLEADGATAFLEKSLMSADKGPEQLLAVLEEIIKKRARKRARAATNAGA